MSYAKIIRSTLALKASASPRLSFKEYDDHFRLTYSSVSGNQNYLVYSSPVCHFSIDEMDWRLSFRITDMMGEEIHVNIESLPRWLQSHFKTEARHLELVEA
jgi:hypothetical protein